MITVKTTHPHPDVWLLDRNGRTATITRQEPWPGTTVFVLDVDGFLTTHPTLRDARAAFLSR